MGYLQDMNDALANAESIEFFDESADVVAGVGMQKERVKRGFITPGGQKLAAQFDLVIEFLRDANFINQKLPVPLFGANDFFSQYARAFSGIPGMEPVTVFTYPFTGNVGIANLSANPGDIILQFTQNTNPGGSAWVKVSCKNVAYSSLVVATLSDRFNTTKLRQILPSTTNLVQFNENIEYLRQSLFGKTNFDSINPNSFKTPQQNQANIVDINLRFLIDKETTLKTYIDTQNYAAAGVMHVVESMSIFVEGTIKTAYNR